MTDDLAIADRWDAGDMSCGELVIHLKRRLDALHAGELLELVSQDLGAPQDLPAWCRLTRHRLRSAEHPVYVIERRSD